MGVSDQRHAPAALLPPGKGPPVTTVQEAHLTHTDTYIEISLHTWCLGGAEVVHFVQCLAYGLDLKTEFRSPAVEKRIFPLASVSRPVLRPTQPPVQWELGPFPQG
jgi:hypothetical protein